MEISVTFQPEKNETIAVNTDFLKKEKKQVIKKHTILYMHNIANLKYCLWKELKKAPVEEYANEVYRLIKNKIQYQQNTLKHSGSREWIQQTWVT